MIRLITSLVAILTVASVQSQTTPKETPKLVIGITIDQLRGDYLEMFQHNFSEKGFKRLLSSGLVYQNINFDFPNINSSAAVATIYTGANPSYHGIIGSRKINLDNGTEISIFEDNEFIGNYTQDKLSPKALKVSTITDELKIASKGASNVYSFAPDAAEAIIMAGHAGNCAYWINDYSGKWATSTYYKDFHWTVDLENRNSIYSTSLGSLSWKPFLPVERYNTFPYTSNIVAFQHHFDSYSLAKKSPITHGNTRNIALQLMEKADMGKRSYPAFLALNFYLGNYPKSAEKSYSVELQDAYIRLDKDIEILLDKVEKTVGLSNTLIFIASTGYYDAEDPYTNVNMPDGVFYADRCEALLNMYLMAIYGKEQWIEKIYNQQIYLNRKLIEKKNLNLEEFQNKAAEFVVQFTGVQDVATSIQLLTGKANDNMIRYKNIFNKDVSGDIFFEVQPGYKVVANEQEAKTTDKRVRENTITAPVIFFGNNIKPERIRRTVNATEIAPTVSHILRIRSPNASKSKPLPELL